jgi:hypothetical protein
MMKRISRAFEGPARAWCRLMHPDPMWPVRGLYRCPSCLRQYPVQWDAKPQAKLVPVVVAPVRVPALYPELRPLLRNAVRVPGSAPTAA